MNNINQEFDKIQYSKLQDIMNAVEVTKYVDAVSEFGNLEGRKYTGRFTVTVKGSDIPAWWRYIRYMTEGLFAVYGLRIRGSVITKPVSDREDKETIYFHEFVVYSIGDLVLMNNRYKHMVEDMPKFFGELKDIEFSDIVVIEGKDDRNA